MKTINPEVARQLSINFFIAHLPILILSGFVVASLVGLIFRRTCGGGSKSALRNGMNDYMRRCIRPLVRPRS